MTQAQDFVAAQKSSTAKELIDRLIEAGAVRLNRLQENAFWQMPDGSEVVVSDARNGRRLIRAVPGRS